MFPSLVVTLLVKAVAAVSISEISPSLANTLVENEALSACKSSISPSAAVTLVSMLPLSNSKAETLALLDTVYPANAESLVASTLLIKVTISANVSVSATEALNIASILFFSVTISPSAVVTLVVKAVASL